MEYPEDFEDEDDWYWDEYDDELCELGDLMYWAETMSSTGSAAIDVALRDICQAIYRDGILTPWQQQFVFMHILTNLLKMAGV